MTKIGQHPDDWSKRITLVQEALGQLETVVAEGNPPPPGLAEFKSAVDDIRLRVWALLSTPDPVTARAFHERFRVRRTLEMCSHLRDDLAQGALTAEHLELGALAEQARALAAAITGRKRKRATEPRTKRR